KIPSPVHSALARLVHARSVVQVISLNWDTLLEAAFQNRYGIPINAQAVKLWKPHGDCAAQDSKWTLPHEPGSIPDTLVTAMTSLVRRGRIRWSSSATQNGTR